MRATLNIPDDLLSEVQRISGEKSKTRAIIAAMEEFVKQRKIKKLLSLKGNVQVEDVTGELEALEVEEANDNDKRWRRR